MSIFILVNVGRNESWQCQSITGGILMYYTYNPRTHKWYARPAADSPFERVYDLDTIGSMYYYRNLIRSDFYTFSTPSILALLEFLTLDVVTFIVEIFIELGFHAMVGGRFRPEITKKYPAI